MQAPLATLIKSPDSFGPEHQIQFIVDPVVKLPWKGLKYIIIIVAVNSNHIQNPTANSNRSVPEKDDCRFVIGLGLDY